MMKEDGKVVHCNNDKCRFNNGNKVCTLEDVCYVDRLCITFRKRAKEDNYKEMMKAPFNSGCYKGNGGKHIGKHGKVIK